MKHSLPYIVHGGSDTIHENKKITSRVFWFDPDDCLCRINLRPFMTGPGPVIDNIIQTTGMSYQSVSLLTLFPMLLMGLCLDSACLKSEIRR
ncbi:putative cyanate transporter [Providencia alcalifaciens]|nr:putative cyanate transporter [Providencia alcalifaciens]